MNKSTGNMYGWVTHTHSHLAGQCEHRCKYCYVQAMANRFPAVKDLYSGEYRIIPGSLDVDFGGGKVIFIDHLNDLFAEGVPDNIIEDVLHHLDKYPNRYVLQTKNPRRYRDIKLPDKWEEKLVLGTAIETDNDVLTNRYSRAPEPVQRAWHLGNMSQAVETFVTIEPIMDFDPPALMQLLELARPDFVCIGADSKGGCLPEPSAEKVNKLLHELHLAGIKVRTKHNLERIR